MVDSYLKGDPDTVGNIRASLNTKLSIYEAIAAAWWHARPRKISLTEWLAASDILILGNEEASRTAIDALNQAYERHFASRREDRVLVLDTTPPDCVNRPEHLIHVVNRIRDALGIPPFQPELPFAEG